jgi:Xaa-Pro dipeptidase
MWSVPPPTLDSARETHDVNDVLHTSSFASSLASALTSGALVHVLPQTAQFPALPLLPATARQSTSYLLSALHRARLTKSAAEITRIRRANAISSRAHEVVMRVLGAGVRRALTNPQGCAENADAPTVALPGEWLIEKEAEAEAIFVASCRREG